LGDPSRTLLAGQPRWNVITAADSKRVTDLGSQQSALRLLAEGQGLTGVPATLHQQPVNNYHGPDFREFISWRIYLQKGRSDGFLAHL